MVLILSSRFLVALHYFSKNKFKTSKRCRRIDCYRYLVLCKRKSDSFNVIVQSCITTSKEIGAPSFSHLPFISPTRSNESWTYRHKNWTIHGWNGPVFIGNVTFVHCLSFLRFSTGLVCCVSNNFFYCHQSHLPSVSESIGST